MQNKIHIKITIDDFEKILDEYKIFVYKNSFNNRSKKFAKQTSSLLDAIVNRFSKPMKPRKSKKNINLEKHFFRNTDREAKIKTQKILKKTSILRNIL